MPEWKNPVLEPDAAFGGSTGLSWQVLCPLCTDRQPTIDRAYRDEPGDHQAVTVHEDRDAYESPMGTRGGRVEIELTCGFHSFTLIIANHKGEEFIGIDY